MQFKFTKIKRLRICLFSWFTTLSCCLLSVQAQEFTAGINTSSPNPHAVLHLVSPNGDQGLLIPKLSTAQRTAMSLDAEDIGLMVYDSDDNVFYFWLNPNWIPLSTSDAQTLDITGNNLSISNGNAVDLSALMDNSDDQTADEVNFTPTGNIAAGTTQAALVELDNEKLAITGGTLSGNLNLGGNNLITTGNVDGRDVSDDGTNQDALQALIGTPAGSTTLGSFSGTTIGDNVVLTTALQQLETALETATDDQAIDNLALTGSSLEISLGRRWPTQSNGRSIFHRYATHRSRSGCLCIE